MRIFSAFFRRLCLCAVVAGLPFLSPAAGKPENVVLQYHFLGAGKLAGNTNAAAARAVFAQKSTIGFENMVLHRIAVKLADTLRLHTNTEKLLLLRPLLNDALRVESMSSFGGPSNEPINCVFAFHLGADHSKLWQENLKDATLDTGEPLQVGTASGWQWSKGAKDSAWMLAANDWLLLGRGGRLAAVRDDYLQQIQKSGRPAPALDFNCFEADVDWPRLNNWFSLASVPFKLGRTQIAISAQKGNFYMVSHVIYPEAIQWQPQPMTFPTNLVREPLLSFATGQNVEPFLKSDETLSRLNTNPFRDQFYFWSMRDLAFESYVAWPAIDPSNTMMTLSAQAIDELNPKLQQLNGTELTWMPRGLRLLWSKLQLIGPSVHPAAATNGPFLVADLFPLTAGKGPAPRALWAQLEGRTNLVYYDWELTGPRVKHLLTVTQVLPILQMLDVGPREPFKAADPRLGLEEAWLANLATFLGKTVTEVTKTGPNELTILRNSPFVFSSLELLLLSHWLSDTPAGPLDMQLLPQAKMSGPGAPQTPH